MRAAYATAAPWLPPDAAITPAPGTLADNKRLKAPRGLKLPVCCSSSSFSVTGRFIPQSMEFSRMTGVCLTWPPILAAAAAILFRLIMTKRRWHFPCEATRWAFFPPHPGPDCRPMQIHGSCASRTGDGVLLIGPPGAGKSDLLLRLLARGFELVADDRVDVVDGIARPSPALAGL